MYCLSCGVQLPEEAMFCDTCGTRQRTREERELAPRIDSMGYVAPPPAAPRPDPVWEYCEVVAVDSFMFRGYKALAATSTGQATIAQASGVYGDVEKASGKNMWRVDGIVSAVIAQGWEPQPKGSKWYSYRFRRQVG